MKLRHGRLRPGEPEQHVEASSPRGGDFALLVLDGRGKPSCAATWAAGEVHALDVTNLSYELGIDSFFGASHAIRPSGERHTHSFRVQARFVTERIDENGMIVGFREVSNLLEAEAKRYANRFLNDMEAFAGIQPTGEHLATIIFRDLETTLAAKLPDGPRLIGLTLWENPTSYVAVEPRRSA